MSTYYGRLIDTFHEGRATVTVRYTASLNEYRCRLAVDGARQEEADYFTDDLQDALDTATTMARDNAVRPDLVPGYITRSA